MNEIEKLVAEFVPLFKNFDALAEKMAEAASDILKTPVTKKAVVCAFLEVADSAKEQGKPMEVLITEAANNLYVERDTQGA